MADPKYKIIRFYQEDESLNRTVVRTGLTLEEAQAHCHDPETSSSTCTSAEGRARTQAHGRWFEGYDEDRPQRATVSDSELRNRSYR